MVLVSCRALTNLRGGWLGVLVGGWRRKCMCRSACLKAAFTWHRVTGVHHSSAWDFAARLGTVLSPELGAVGTDTGDKLFHFEAPYQRRNLTADRGVVRAR